MSGVNLKFKSDVNGSLTLESADGGMVTFRPDGTICVSSMGPIQISGKRRAYIRELDDYSPLRELERDLRKK